MLRPQLSKYEFQGRPRCLRPQRLSVLNVFPLHGLALLVVFVLATVANPSSAALTTRLELKSPSQLELMALQEQQKNLGLKAAGETSFEAVLQRKSKFLSTINATVGGQSFAFALDTGSANTWITTTSCSSVACGFHPNYDPSKSTTLTQDPEAEPMVITFGTGEIEGSLAKDTFRIETLDSASPIVVADQDILLVTAEVGKGFQTDDFEGLIGLAFPALAVENSTTFLENTIAHDLVNKPQFYFFLGPSEQFFVMGEPSNFKDQYLGNDIVYHPIAEQYYWAISFDDVLFNGESLLTDEIRSQSCAPTGCKLVFDSGSTFNTMPGPSYAELSRRHHTICNGAQTNFTVSYVINGTIYEFTSTDVTTILSNSSASECPVLLFSQIDVQNDHGPVFVAGQVFLRKFLTIFNYQTSQPTIGLAPLNIAYHHGASKQSTSLRQILLSQLRQEHGSRML